MLKIQFSFILYVAAAILFWGSPVFAQSNKVSATKNTQQGSITFNMQKKAGIGPSGRVSSGIASYDLYGDNEEYKAYPQVKNKPTALHNVVEYFYILNRFQFYYQSYCAGIYSKPFFLDKLKEQKLNVADTVKLSKKAIKCGITVLGGLNEANEIVYIVDAANDGDFGNDVLRPMPKRSYGYYDPASMVPVQIEYVSGKVIKQEKLLVMITNSNSPGNQDSKISLAFAFPEFRYAWFTYQGQPYFISSDVNGQSVVSVMPDEPNFDSMPYEARVGLNQFIKLGDKTFKLTGFDEGGRKITIAVDDVRDFSLTPSTVTVKKVSGAKPAANANIVSSQVGFLAPVIKGYNINPMVKETDISTANLKGKYIFVDFWSSFCGPCIAEFPYLKEVYQKFNREKFEIIGVLDERDLTVTSRLIKEGNMIWPTIKANVKGADTKGYKIDSYPTTYLIDPEGKIIAMDLRGNELLNKLTTLIK